MTHRRNPISLHGVIERAADEVGGWEAAGDIIGKTRKWVRDASNPDLEGRHTCTLSYEHVRALTRTGKCMAFIEDLARLADCHLVPVAQAAPTINLHAAIGNLGMQAGEAMMVISAALADGVITPNERADMTRELLDVQGAVTALLVQLQELPKGDKV